MIYILNNIFNYMYNTFESGLNGNNNCFSFTLTVIIILLAILCVLLRIIITTGYKFNLASFNTEKPIDEISSGLLNRIITEYAGYSDKSESTAELITKKHVLKINVIGFNFISIEKFIKYLELLIPAFIMLAILIASINDFISSYWFIFLVIIFFSVKLFSIIFDSSTMRERLLLEIITYIQKHVTKSNDTISIDNKSLDKFCNSLIGVMRLGLSDISKGLDNCFKNIVKFSETTDVIFENWEKTIQNAVNVQDNIGNAAKIFEQTVLKLNESSQTLKDNLQVYHGQILKYDNERDDELNNIKNIVSSINDMIKINEHRNEIVGNQLKYIESNQNLLESSIVQYKASLEMITKDLGNALSNIVDYQNQKSAQLLSENMKQLIDNNSILVDNIKKTFDELYEHTYTQTKTILSLKEQIDSKLS